MVLKEQILGIELYDSCKQVYWRQTRRINGVKIKFILSPEYVV